MSRLQTGWLFNHIVTSCWLTLCFCTFGDINRPILWSFEKALLNEHALVHVLPTNPYTITVSALFWHLFQLLRVNASDSLHEKLHRQLKFTEIFKQMGDVCIIDNKKYDTQSQKRR